MRGPSEDVVALHRSPAMRLRVNADARMIEPRRIALVNPGWATVIAAVLLWLVGMYCIDLASGLEGNLLSGYSARQMIFGCLGLLVGAACAVPHYRLISLFAWPLAIFVTGLLIFVLVPFVPDSIVAPRNGARRWINLGLMDFQPSEVAKVAFVLVIAGYLRFRRNHRRFLGLIPPALITFVPMALILVEPDLGTALLFLPTLLAMLVAAGAKLRHLILTGLFGAGFALAVIIISLTLATQDRYPLLRPHQVERIQALVDQYRGDQRHVQDRGFQGQQARTLIGAGGLLGNEGQHSRALVHFSSLPERHNDMVFAVVVNRLGLVGGLGVLLLYLTWIWGATWIAAECKDPFGRLIVVGFAAMLATQSVINIGMNIGLLPITGMTLPFISYGGASLIMGFVMTGLILNVGLRRPAYLWRESFEFREELD